MTRFFLWIIRVHRDFFCAADQETFPDFPHLATIFLPSFRRRPRQLLTPFHFGLTHSLRNNPWFSRLSTYQWEKLYHRKHTHAHSHSHTLFLRFSFTLSFSYCSFFILCCKILNASFVVGFWVCFPKNFPFPNRLGEIFLEFPSPLLRVYAPSRPRHCADLFRWRCQWDSFSSSSLFSFLASFPHTSLRGTIFKIVCCPACCVCFTLSSFLPVSP